MRRMQKQWIMAMMAVALWMNSCDDGAAYSGYIPACTPEDCDPEYCDNCTHEPQDPSENLMDTDGDTVPDLYDNCVTVYNPGQENTNGGDLGDVCNGSNAIEIKDIDGDTIPDDEDNCPFVANPNQADSDGDTIGDACDIPELPADSDGDTIPDDKDNCPDTPNPDQADSDGDTIGDACRLEIIPDGSPEAPFVIPTQNCSGMTQIAGDTSKSANRLIDVYPLHPTINESGAEYYYTFTLARKSQVSLYLDPEPSGVDVDIHLLSGLHIQNQTVPEADFIARSDRSVLQTLEAGTYYVVVDTFVKDGVEKPGKYVLNLATEAIFEGKGTTEAPFLIACGESVGKNFVFSDKRSTKDSISSVFDHYGSSNANESGNEFVYQIAIHERVRLSAVVRGPESAGADIDIHLLSDLKPTLIARDDREISAIVDPGTYYIVADSFNGKNGGYVLDIQTRSAEPSENELFNAYILKAVAHLYANWRLKGYGASAYSHDLVYGNETIYKGPKAPYTMCVAAVAETMLVAMELYSKETGDTSVWEHLAKKSWTGQNSTTIKGHLWVDSNFSRGTGDALTHFGMGMTVPFESLKPGAFINLNRSSGSGHAVVFIAFIDDKCQEYAFYNDKVIGFKYFSSQGKGANGGMDYRLCRFEDVPKPACTNDAAIRSTNQTYFNTGMMWHPKYWLKTSQVMGVQGYSAPTVGYFDIEKFNGITEM